VYQYNCEDHINAKRRGRQKGDGTQDSLGEAMVSFKYTPRVYVPLGVVYI